MKEVPTHAAPQILLSDSEQLSPLSVLSKDQNLSIQTLAIQSLNFKFTFKLGLLLNHVILPVKSKTAITLEERNA